MTTASLHRSPLRRRAAAIGLSAALVATPIAGSLAPQAVAAPGAGPALSSTVITPGREIGLAGTENTRTLDGYAGANGRRVNGLVLRSDSLAKITSADKREMRKRKVTTVVDLRTVYEKKFQPNRPMSGVKTVEADVLGTVSPVALIDLNQGYAAFVTDRHARAAIAAAIRAIESTAARGGATLYHCSAGKDRTGWVTATLLTILGVDKATVRADFLASNTYRHASPRDVLNGVNDGLLNTAYHAVHRRYGSMDRYIRVGLGITASDIASLRSSLLR